MEGEGLRARQLHRASPYKGDDHHWGVWHGHEDFTKYRRVVPFRREAGMNTFPVVENYRKFTPAEKLWPLDPTWAEYRGEMSTRFHHLKKLDRYANEFGPSSSIEDYITKSQLSQALANEFNLEYSRMHKFTTSGILVWQFNDAWPAVSWSLVDWYGTPKPSYYRLKRAAQPLHIALDFEKYAWAPGETLRYDAFAARERPAAPLQANLTLSCWNCAEQTVPVRVISGEGGAPAKR